MRQSLKLTSKSSFEEAMTAGERFATEFKLGPIPAEKLPEVMEQKLGILVLMVDTIEGVSGAACRLPDLDAVLINRREVAGRRNFDLAHELFHVLTWDTTPPEYVEEATEYARFRVEELANNFASALLMPEASLKDIESASAQGDIVPWLNATADKLQVTATALKWRLVALNRLMPLGREKFQTRCFALTATMARSVSRPPCSRSPSWKCSGRQLTRAAFRRVALPTFLI